MKLVLTCLMAAVLCLGLVAGVTADEEKAVTMEGKVTCPKCELKKADKCATVLVVKKGDEETIYWFDKDSHSKDHKEICSEGKAAKVTATVTEKDGKKWLKVTKLEWAKT